MISEDIISSTWKNKLKIISKGIFQYEMVKPLPSDWTEKNIILPDSTTKFPGPFRYRVAPYAKEIVNLAHRNSFVRYFAVMKSSQCGITAGVVVPMICYKIVVDPAPILFTAADKDLAGRTIKERLDPIMGESGLSKYIRPNAIKKVQKRTGDTQFSKEFAGGTLTAAGTSNPDTFRMFSAEVILADDFETAPAEAGESGDITKVMEGRQKMYGDSALTGYISTPKVTATSQIYKQYLRGTQKKWHWPCPECGTYVPIEFSVLMADNTRAGLVWKLDEKYNLIPESIHYRTQCCGEGKIYYKDKMKMNSIGCWIATNPNPEKYFESYQLNDITIPPTFDSWEKIVSEWLLANPRGQKPIVKELQTFFNERLGLPFEEMGITPKSTALMENTRGYHPGIIPDKTSEEDLNGKIILITLACDLNGLLDDARLDWEILAHAANGATYSIDHGSIGTFERTRQRTKTYIDNETNRDKWTYTHNIGLSDKNDISSVWPELKKVINRSLPTESGMRERLIDISVVDMGFHRKLALQFIIDMQESGVKVFGVLGKKEAKYRKNQRDTQPVKRSIEFAKRAYNVEVNQVKSDLAQMMQLRPGDEGNPQPMGFMNYPEPNNGKYEFKNYFFHYEGEVMKEERDANGEVVGYTWDKKTSDSPNHFWDIRVYNLAAPLIYIDELKLKDPIKYKNLTWEDFVLLVTA